MYKIINNVKDELIINKSKFISFAIYISNVQMVNDVLDKLKKEYKDATHICYAYKIGNVKRFNDDNEPKGTAGMPILNVIENKELDNILVVVVRYFGGIKLGTGGLVRAYTKSVTECLKLCNTEEERQWITFQINVNYDNLKYIYKYINETYIKEKSFDNIITLSIKMPYDEYLSIKESINSILQIL